MGMHTLKDLLFSPLAGAIWKTAVFTEIRKHLAVEGSWQLAFWRDRTKEADFLFHRAGHFRSPTRNGQRLHLPVAYGPSCTKKSKAIRLPPFLLAHPTPTASQRHPSPTDSGYTRPSGTIACLTPPMVLILRRLKDQVMGCFGVDGFPQR